MICGGDLTISSPHPSLLFQGQTNVVAGQAVSKKNPVENEKKKNPNLKNTHPVGMCSTAQHERCHMGPVYQCWLSSMPADPGWLLLALPPLSLCALDPEGAYQLRCIALQGQALPGIKWRLIGARSSPGSAGALPGAAVLLTWPRLLLRAVLEHPPPPAQGLPLRRDLSICAALHPQPKSAGYFWAEGVLLYFLRVTPPLNHL